MSEKELLSKYNEIASANTNEPVLYQLVKVLYPATSSSSENYEDGYIQEIYDECYIIRTRTSLVKIDLNSKNPEKVQLLHNNGRPVIAGISLLGRRKFTR